MGLHSGMKLGRKPARHDPRTLRMVRFLSKTLPPPPLTVDWMLGITDWGEMLNDVIGDCTCAAAGHFIQEVTANLGKCLTPTDTEILEAYQAVSGYDGTPFTDNGAVELDVLNYWRKTGIAGRKLLAYADMDIHNHDHVKQGIFVFGGVYIGLDLPLSAQDQLTWDVYSDPGLSEPNSWGGHAVLCPSYNLIGPLCITWGQRKQMTWAFWDKYCSEAHALLMPEWASVANVGLDLPTLTADLAEVTN